jgi:ATP-dependent Lon protease
MNDRNKINPVLRDRLHIVTVPDPSQSDKIATAKTILIPEILDCNNLATDEVEFPDEVLAHILDTRCKGQSGMRSLKQTLEAIIQRVAYLKHTLISLPFSAVWHAAQQQLEYVPPPSVTASIVERDAFAKQTSFYFPEFQIPLKLTPQCVEKLLHNLKIHEEFDYVKSGWIR